MTEQSYVNEVTETRPLGLVVSNPGGFPWLPQLSAAAARRGDLSQYCSPLGFAPADFEGRLRALPGRARGALSRRALPPAVEPDMARRSATVAELAGLVAQRLRRPAMRRRAVGWRNETIDRFAAGLLNRNTRAVVACNGAALATIRRARDVGAVSILDYPITHHDFSRRVMVEEIERVPDYAVTSQGHELLPERFRRLEEEIGEADFILTLSASHRRSFLEAGVPENRLIDHPLGVDCELFMPRPRIVDGVFRIMFSGQITQRKGISYLVEAFEKARIPQSELVLVGQIVGSSAPWAGVPGVRHVPAVPRPLLPELYARSDVYVMPSLLEGCCQTALEAMAMGRPTIASENTFDVISDGRDGFVVPIRDAEAIAERLRELHRDPDLSRRLGSAARRTAERHDWRVYGPEVLGLIRERAT